jgi:tetratricopeptide (TPR) repeat protein
MPEMILVSIQNTVRTRDLTPTVDKNKKFVTGGADKFLRFVETEVIPLVEKNYRTQPYRIFAGHSYGGLTVVHSFLTRPELFNAYIAVSPYLHWDNDLPIKRAEEIFKQKKDWKKTMFLALGDEPEYVNAFNSFKELLDRTKPQNFDYEFQRYPDEIHTSIALRGYNAGLRKIYAGWYPPQMNSAALENHYKKLSEKFGYQIKMPDDAFHQMAVRLGKENKLKEAIDLFKRSIELFPNNLITYGVLGETYEKNGQLKEARDSFEKGYKMATAQSKTQLAEAFKGDFERISAKLK